MLDGSRKKAAEAELAAHLAQMERHAERVLRYTGDLATEARIVLRAAWSAGLTPQQRVPRLAEAGAAIVKLRELADVLEAVAFDLSADVVEASRLNADLAGDFTS